MNAAALFLFCLSFLPVSDTYHEQVDLVELNHFYDEQGRLVFDQCIWYDWSENDARYNVRAWRLIKNTNVIPVFSHEDKSHISFWYDGEQLRKLYAKSFRETWTQFDPELVEREYLPKEKRKELGTIQRKETKKK